MFPRMPNTLRLLTYVERFLLYPWQRSADICLRLDIGAKLCLILERHKALSTVRIFSIRY